MLCGVPVLGPVSGQPPSSEAKKPERPPWMPSSLVHPWRFFIGQIVYLLFSMLWSKHGLNILAMSLVSPGTRKGNHYQPCLVPQMRTHWAGVLARGLLCRESQKHQKDQDDAKKDETRPAMMAHRMMKFGWAGRCETWVNLRKFVMQTYGRLCTRSDRDKVAAEDLGTWLVTMYSYSPALYQL